VFIYKSILVLFILFSASLVSTSGYSGDIYKWTDADGNVHFGDKPDNQAAAKYKVPKNNTSNVSYTNKERAEKQKKLLDSFQADRREKQQKQATKNKNNKAKKYNCQVSKDRLVRYQNASRIYTRNDVGEKTFLDKKQRQQETELMKIQIKKWCG